MSFKKTTHLLIITAFLLFSARALAGDNWTCYAAIFIERDTPPMDSLPGLFNDDEYLYSTNWGLSTGAWIPYFVNRTERCVDHLEDNYLTVSGLKKFYSSATGKTLYDLVCDRAYFNDSDVVLSGNVNASDVDGGEFPFSWTDQGATKLVERVCTPTGSGGGGGRLMDISDRAKP